MVPHGEQSVNGRPVRTARRSTLPTQLGTTQLLPCQCRAPRSRGGFTLTELLVVISIVLLLSIVTVPVALRMNDGRTLRDTSRTLQALFAGARERAMASQQPVGVRLVPDQGDPSIVRSLVYIEESPPLNQGRAMVVHSTWPDPRSTTNPEPINTVVLIGVSPQSLLTLPKYRDPVDNLLKHFGSIRFGLAGERLNFKALPDNTGINHTFGGDPYPKLTLSQPLALPIPFGSSVDLADNQDIWHPNSPKVTALPDGLLSVGTEYVIPLGNRVRPGEEPIALPNGLVIDLGYLPPPNPSDPSIQPDPPEQRLSRIRPAWVGYDANGQWDIGWDIMMSPAGRVVGTAAAESQIVLWIRELTAGIDIVDVGTNTNPAVDVGTNSGKRKLVRQVGSGNNALLAIFPRTGRVQSSTPELIVSATPTSLSTYFDPRSYFNLVNSGKTGGL